ncbi:MAG: DUF86 domain-containing protein [Fimbriimonadales bacterium]|nr:DUF86 domain-containing protein [Fimbriimonadales bacterium]
MRSDRAYLLDMLNAARDAQSFTSEMTFEAFQQSLLHQMATLKAIEIIGEAASRLSESFKNSHPEVPWRAIVGMRNRLVHGYFEVDYQRVWDTVQQDLPTLIQFLEKVLNTIPVED